MTEAGTENEAPDWLSTPAVARYLSTTKDYLTAPEIIRAVRRKSRSTRGASGRAVGYLWYRPDIEALQHIRRLCDLTVREAARVFENRRKLPIS